MRTRHRDSHGYGRSIPVMLGVRVRLAPAWIRSRWPRAALAAAAVVVIAVGLVLLSSGPGVRCHPTHSPGRESCR